MIYFVGAGSGAPDLITVRGAKLLGEADVIVYAGSLVNPALLDYKKEGCAVYDSAKMTLEEVIAVMAPAARAGKTVVRLHTGDPCVYGAHREQMDELDKLGLPYEICPGVSSFCGAASIDIKKDEPGLLLFCETHGLALTTFSAETLRQAAGDFTPSAFVAETVGVDNVCERAAVCAAGGGRLLCRKTARDGVTVALAARDFRVTFE